MWTLLVWGAVIIGGTMILAYGALVAVIFFSGRQP